MQLKKGTFGLFPTEMCKGLPALHQVVFAWLCSHANESGECWPSLNTLAKESGMSKMSVIRSVEALEALGYITKEERSKDGRKEKDSNKYTVILKEVVTESDHVVTESDHPSHSELPGVVTESDCNKPNRTKPIELKNTYGQIRDLDHSPPDKIPIKKKKATDRMTKKEFGEFWSEYPRKVKKKVAEKKYLSLTRKMHDKILSALEEFKNTEEWMEEGGQYIPHPSTWLNQERWEDDLDTTVSDVGAKFRAY